MTNTSSEIDTTKKYDGLVAQVQAEYDLAWRHQQPKKTEWESRLKLYNNQKRDKDAVGDTTLFTIFQTVLASLYSDRLIPSFGGRQSGDEDVADNLTAMAKSDYSDMEKDITDFEWIWDTLFFGRGLLMLSEYERDPDNGIYLPIPEVLDPITFLRDPRATSVNGNRQGKGSARFFGREVKMTKQVIEELSDRVDSFKMSELAFGSGTRSLLQEAIDARDTAQGRQNQKRDEEANLGANAEYDITEWHTHFKLDDKVEKVKVWLANERNTIIGLNVLKTKAKRVIWPLIDRPLYPTSHDWDGTSIPDITEDKQRARAVAQNLGIRAMKADIDPMYVFDSNKIINRKDLNFGFNKFIPVDGKGENLNSAIVPMRKAMPNLGLLDFLYNSLSASAEKAAATPELQQGMLSQKDRTLGEINIAASKADTRYSLAAKIFGWSEKRFWQQWYRLYKDNFAKTIDEKVLRIEGAFGAKWRPLLHSNIIAKIDPDVFIESRTLARAKQIEERTGLTNYFGMALQDPTSNRRWGLKKLGRLYGLEKDEIDRLFPPTIDERIAEDENDKLNENKFVEVKAEDDHNAHLEIHMKAADTNATYAHIEMHKEALSIKKVKPELFPQQPETTAFQPPGTSKITPPSIGQQPIKTGQTPPLSSPTP